MFLLSACCHRVLSIIYPMQVSSGLLCIDNFKEDVFGLPLNHGVHLVQSFLSMSHDMLQFIKLRRFNTRPDSRFMQYIGTKPYEPEKI